MIETLIIALAGLSSSLVSYQATAEAYIEPPQVVARPLSTEEMVQQKFYDAPEMIEIIKCESGFRQFDSKGNVLTSYTNDRGVAQINHVHDEEAKRLGFDLDTTQGNLGFARYLYEREGTRPWVCADKV